jgi:hypothetical protein
MMNITITLTIDEANYVLSALGSRPFAEVADLIFKIKKDAESQINPAPAPQEPATAD